MLPTDAASREERVRDLYSNHHGWLHGWLRRRLGDVHHAADVAHDTYLRVIVSERTPSEEQARPHLLQIAKGRGYWPVAAMDRGLLATAALATLAAFRLGLRLRRRPVTAGVDEPADSRKASPDVEEPVHG